MFCINNLTVQVDDLLVVKDITLKIKPGTIHALMGPNGAGKSSLALALAGHPRYTITAGSIRMDEHDITMMSPDERARSGIFLAFQQPPAIPGVTVATFMREACRAVQGDDESLAQLQERMESSLNRLGLAPSFAQRGLNEGFSGGEKKRLEMLQLMLLKPRMVILDEIDSGLDVDALRQIAECVQMMRQDNPQMSILMVTHYQRILEYIVPDAVHIMAAGSLARSGDATLVQEIERGGYGAYRQSTP